MSAEIKIQAPNGGESCVVYYFQGTVSTVLRNDLRGKKCMVHEVNYPKEPDMPRSNMKDSTVF